MMSSINIFSLNVGLSNNLAGLSSIIQCEKVDVIFLQEVRLSGPRIEFLLPGFKAASNIDMENPDKPGIAIAWQLLSCNLTKLQKRG